MEIQNWYLEVPRQARIAQIGEVHENLNHIWITFHGYRQLAPNFIRKLEPLAAADTLILAPEGLSRFYLEEPARRVGASWMTREERLKEIEDQHTYLNLMWEQISIQLPPNIQVHVLGFSQGVATAWRWLSQQELEPASFFMWAGSIPEEFSPSFTMRLNRARMVALVGDDDPLINLETFELVFAAWQQRFPHLQRHIFAGKHKIMPKPLEVLKEMVIRDV